MRARQDTRLLDVEAAPGDAWTGSLELVHVGDVCPDGHGPLAAKTATQGVLFRHGGYGAPVRTTWLICLVCFWSLEAEVVETNPKRWAS